MGLDDSNDKPGAPGECPDEGHSWQVREIVLDIKGGRLLLGCKWCDAWQWEASDQD